MKISRQNLHNKMMQMQPNTMMDAMPLFTGSGSTEDSDKKLI
jgi:hypothetical protein